MAEFQEVMKQAKRMCSGNDNCDSCLVCEIIGAASCPFVQGYMRKAGEIERIVMDWAAAHPEPRYPSWKEWWEEKFPNADSLIRPCMFESEEYFGCKNFIGCEQCINTPIPADIAEKLGVKPIGGENDERASF